MGDPHVINDTIGMAELMAASDLDAERKEMADIIRTGSEVLVSIVSDILDFSKMEAGGLQVEEVAFD